MKPDADPPYLDDSNSSSLRLTEWQLDRFYEGDLGALNQLFQRYYPVVQRIVATHMGIEMRELMEADDLVQEALVKAFRYIEGQADEGVARFEHRSEGSFRHWLAEIVRNSIHDGYRGARAAKRDHRRVTGFGPDADHGLVASLVEGREQSPSQEFALIEALRRREAAILHLPESHRELINLREHCGLSFGEIGELLGKKADTVRAMYQRAADSLDKSAWSS